MPRAPHVALAGGQDVPAGPERAGPTFGASYKGPVWCETAKVSPLSADNRMGALRPRRRMRLIPASFLRAPRLPRSPSTCRRRPTAWLYGSALLALAGGLSPAVSAASAKAPASITDATTGLPDAASIVPVAACATAGPDRATCLAQVL